MLLFREKRSKDGQYWRNVIWHFVEETKNAYMTKRRNILQNALMTKCHNLQNAQMHMTVQNAFPSYYVFQNAKTENKSTKFQILITSIWAANLKFRNGYIICDFISKLQVYKNVNHVKNVCQSALCHDIETNPGPVYIDPAKTIAAPYSQGNEIIFGETAGQQCLAMCLCALIYNNRQGIYTSQDLVQLMTIGNQLYSHLSNLTRQTFLMFTELPTQLTVFDTDYCLKYSESYSGTVIGDCQIEGYQYCMPFHRAFQLLSDDYNSFILTIESIAVCIYYTHDGKYKIFD